MEDILYWIIEYVKVFLGYGFLMFVWPSVVFRKYLRTKSLTFRFGFCTTVQVLLVNTTVLMLGLFHILNPVTMWIAFYGTLLWSLSKGVTDFSTLRKKIRHLMKGTYGWKHMLLHLRLIAKRVLKRAFQSVWKVYRVHWLEYTLLLLTVIYGMAYFSYAPFQDHSFGFGDMYVHHSWTYELTQGNIFSEGVYPEGMHCVLYSLHTLFGIDIYSSLLFLAGIHVGLTLVAAYCMMKEVFHWRFTPIFVLILFLTLDVVCVNEVFSMSRLQWTLPQEYGFPTMYLCALFLVKHLKNDFTTKLQIRNKEYEGCWDENLLVFLLALAASIVIHFYVTIMAFLICVSFALFMLKNIFSKKHFGPLVAAVLCALVIAVVPMAGALASGIPFQGSIGWAMSIMSGVDPEQGYTQIAGPTSTEVPQTQQQNPSQGMEESSGNVSGNTGGVVGEGGSSQPVTPIPQLSLSERIGNKLEALKTKVEFKFKEIVDVMYWQGYVTLYKQERANWILGFTGLSIALWIVYGLVVCLGKWLLKKQKPQGGFFTGYISITMATIVFMIIYNAAPLGLPGLVAGARLCSTEQLLILAMMMVPVDIIFTLLRRLTPDRLMQGVSLVTAVGLVVFVWCTGNFHGYLYYELTRYNAAVMVTNRIMEELPQNTYTIVSTTDEIYQVIEDGRHEELLTFLTAEAGERYTIPTEYVFIYVEKHPLKYAHNHFFSGPDWLAWERYQEIYAGHDLSVCPDVFSATISEEEAKKKVMYYGRPSLSYSTFASRIILESKAFEWCERFQELYPNELKTYYEDDDFVCYYIRQNTQFLYDLVLE